MILSRQEILEIAKANNMEYVHETFLIRFVEQLLTAAKAKEKL
jgi:hypothetical protein